MEDCRYSKGRDSCAADYCSRRWRRWHWRAAASRRPSKSRWPRSHMMLSSLPGDADAMSLATTVPGTSYWVEPTANKVVWHFMRQSGEYGRYVAELSEAGSDKTRVTTRFEDGPADPGPQVPRRHRDDRRRRQRRRGACRAMPSIVAASRRRSASVSRATRWPRWPRRWKVSPTRWTAWRRPTDARPARPRK